MRRISPAFALAALLLPSNALAQLQHHRMTPGEVLLSSGGDDAIQYIELVDASNEPFPDGDYVLGIYDVDGALIDSVTVGVTPSSTRVFVATAAADTEFETTRDATLPVTLPANGQACFERDTGDKFGCMAWGCVNTVLAGTTIGTSGRGASPADGMSLQRQADGTYDIAAPTPDAANAAGDATPACPTDPDAGPSDIDAGADGDIDAGPTDPDAGGGSGDGGDGDDDDSGCGCGASSPSTGLTGLVLVLAIFVVSRSRRVRGRGTRT